MISEQRLSEIESLVEKGNGPDEWEVVGNTVTYSKGYWTALPGDIPKAALIGQAPSIIRELLDEIRQTRG